jgi:hypothetical protein
MLEASWNVMAHAPKPDFVFQRNGRVPLNRQGRQFSRLLTAEVCESAVVMLDTPCSEVVWEYWLPTPSPVSPSLPLPCVTVCHHISTGVYYKIVVIWEGDQRVCSQKMLEKKVLQWCVRHLVNKYIMLFSWFCDVCGVSFFKICNLL